ncbi:MAG: hypothetical protein GY708_04045 [Actinomycetia bacterium]|nr:hypothetical protein [Actinomycetes bacterium]MCP4962363.1 hypothetical protein [Actinomycetes bacterium]
MSPDRQFITHVHSDHLIDLHEVAMACWIRQQTTASGPLVIVSPEGHSADFAREVFDVFKDDINTRTKDIQPGPPEIDSRTFEPTAEPQDVW